MKPTLGTAPQLINQFEALREIENPLSRMGKMVNTALSVMPAWGRDPLKALAGEDTARIISSALATSPHAGMGGNQPEMLELMTASKELETARQANPKSYDVINAAKKKVADEFADVLMMVLAWGRRLGVSAANIDKAVADACNRISDRFVGVLKFAQRGHADLQQLTQNPVTFDKFWKIVKARGIHAAESYTAAA